MTFRRFGLSIAACVVALAFAHPAAAQYDGPKRAPKETPPAQTAPKGATCAPSGFTKLTRNCTANVGNCQRMPDSCSNGWCCP